MKLSIITINFNDVNGLKRTIDSVVSQVWKEFEWIVIDGGSTDGSRELLEHYQSYFSYWCSEPDNGIYHAMNKGISHTSGEYLNFMNAGDTFYDSSVLLKVFSQPHNEDILYGNWMQVYDDHKKYVSYPADASIWNLYSRTINQQAMFVKNTILSLRGFDESFRIQGDRHRWIIAALEGCTFKHIGITVNCYYMYGVSTQGKKMPFEDEKIDSLIPYAYLSGIKKLYVYENAHYYVRLTKLMGRGGFAAYITNAFLKVMSLLFK